MTGTLRVSGVLDTGFGGMVCAVRVTHSRGFGFPCASRYSTQPVVSASHQQRLHDLWVGQAQVFALPDPGGRDLSHELPMSWEQVWVLSSFGTALNGPFVAVK